MHKNKMERKCPTRKKKLCDWEIRLHQHHVGIEKVHDQDSRVNDTLTRPRPRVGDETQMLHFQEITICQATRY